jgi:hypothetical protein
MLLTEQEFVMTAHKKKNDPSQEQDQDQDQKQANLQAQAQGQLQGQAQGQAQLAVQSLESNSDNDNDNHNNNSNKNYNDVSNDVDNKLDNKVDNDVDNKVENTVDNKVNVDVDIKVDLDLRADGLSSPVIDLHGINDIYDSVIIPDVVNQNLNGGNSNAFNIDQVNNLVDNDYLYDPKVSFHGGDLDMHAKAEGGDHLKVESEIGNIAGNAASGVNAHADAALTQDAFNQTITQGANIQFNSITMNVAGHDLHDSHDLG